MKTKSLLAASLVLVMGMAGCSKSIDDESPVSGKADNVLLVTLPNTVKSTRAIEDPVDGNTTGLKDVTVFLLNGYIVEKVAEFEQQNINDHYLRIEQVSSSVDRVIVIANKADENILGLKNVDEIRNYPFTVKTQHKGQGLDNRTLMGEANVVAAPEEDPNSDGHLFKKAVVTLNAITARLEIGAVVPGDGVDKVDLIAVYVNNAYGTYPQKDLIFHKEDDPCWVVDMVNNPGANVGSKDPISAFTPEPYDPQEYTNLGDAQVKQSSDSKVYAYHVFPGNIPHIVMLVKLELLEGYYEVDDLGNPLKYKYGYVTFSKFNTGLPSPDDYVKEMLPHNIYKMGVGSKGIKINAKDVTDKPEKGPYDLGVYVDILPWEINEVTPEV
ncbi:hypothetical protein [Bacteroides sp. 51]|uniref:hypothetical protein n=1 Tax=Bacteroides sp. 51 TaxID=2302938 RepID=UPI0013D74366|nr:hypothetical protein [Bacteroides sp. 51]NDV81647.1 hypothetical protein [Bacteroides sp. 51]